MVSIRGIKGYQWDYDTKLPYALFAFDLVNIMGLSLNDVFNMDSFYNHFLRYFATMSDTEQIIANQEFNQYNVMDLNYSTMFKIYPNDNINYWNLLKNECCNGEQLTNLYSGLALVSILENNDYSFSFYDKAGRYQFSK